MTEKPTPYPDTVNHYVADFQKRFVEFDRERQADLRHMKHDLLSRLYSEHVVFGDKLMYDGLLQGMLTDEEHEMLETEPHFTRAWRIFVNLCWLKKRLKRAGIIVVGVLFAILLVALILWVVPQVSIPTQR